MTNWSTLISATCMLPLKSGVRLWKLLIKLKVHAGHRCWHLLCLMSEKHSQCCEWEVHQHHHKAECPSASLLRAPLWLLITRWLMKLSALQCMPRQQLYQQSNHNFIITLLPFLFFYKDPLLSDSALNSLITRLTNLSQVKTGTSFVLSQLAPIRANWHWTPLFLLLSSSLFSRSIGSGLFLISKH